MVTTSGIESLTSLRPGQPRSDSAGPHGALVKDRARLAQDVAEREAAKRGR